MPKRTIIEVKQQTEAPKVSAKLEVWDIGGAFILPGTRKRVGLSKVRVIAKDRTAASADMVSVLLEKFRKDLPEGHTFSPHFAIYHLQWERYVPKQVVAAAEVPIPQPATEEPAKEA